jgi:hypothetical protein
MVLIRILDTRTGSNLSPLNHFISIITYTFLVNNLTVNLLTEYTVHRLVTATEPCYIEQNIVHFWV